MAKLKIGNGIQLEAKLPEDISPKNVVIEKKQEKIDTTLLDSISQKLINAQDDVLGCIKKHKELNEKVHVLNTSFEFIKQKVDKHREDLLELADKVNTTKHKEPALVKSPEIKQITFHKDHTSDIESVYELINDLEKEFRSCIDHYEYLFSKKIKLQETINLLLGAACVVSLVLNLL